jgi:hypothetical protein
MMNAESTYERTPNILINKNNNMNKNLNRTHDCHYNLHANVFDPLNFSPPNEFKIKLYTRIYNYDKKKL